MRNESQKSFDRGVQNQVDVWKEEKKIGKREMENRSGSHDETILTIGSGDVAFGELCIQLILRLAKFFNDRRCYLKIRKMHRL